VKFWLKIGDDIGSDPSVLGLIVTHPSNAAYNKTTDFEKVARVGEWTLYQASLSDFSNYTDDFTPEIVFVRISPSLSLYIDDVRMQPSNALATANVYDLDNFRLIAQFNDQHFGLFYQYNDEGKLIRKMAETENGLKTVTETQYNIPTTSR
jgi:hypothetical protein